MKDVENLINRAWSERALPEEEEVRRAIFDTVVAPDKGKLCVAGTESDGWKANEWVKKAVILYFPLWHFRLAL